MSVSAADTVSAEKQARELMRSFEGQPAFVSPRGTKTIDVVDNKSPAPPSLEQVTLDCRAAPRVRALLDRSERRRADGFRNEYAREQYTLGRCALKLVLSEHLEVDAGQVEFAEGDHGKPCLASHGMPSLHFNLSHSTCKVLIAISRVAQVGVDIEALDRPWPGPLMRRLLSEPQLQQLVGLPPEQRSEGLCDFWVRKEAYVKALGVGIAAGFDFPPARDSIISSLRVGPRHRAAVCAASAATASIRRRRLSQILASAGQ